MRGVDLHLGDWRAAPLAGRLFSAIVTDPPYERHMHDAKAGKRAVRADGHANPPPVDFDAITDGDRADLCALAKAQCEGWLLLFCTPEGVAAWRDAIEAAGLKYKRAMPWIKPDSAPQFNGQGPAGCCEMIVAAWCGAGHSRWNGGGGRGAFYGAEGGPVFTNTVNGPARDGRHPTEKPVALMERLLTLFTNPGDLILDPYMGGGSTGVAARRLARMFVGCEAAAHHFATAEDRLHVAPTASGQALGPLFAEGAP